MEKSNLEKSSLAHLIDLKINSLEEALIACEQGLTVLEQNNSEINGFLHSLNILLVRDQIQIYLAQDFPNAHVLSRLVTIDQRLRQLLPKFGKYQELLECRQNLQMAQQITEVAWWWSFDQIQFLDPNAPSIHHRFDWLWNLGSAACLVFATTFITQTAQAFSNEGFDVLGTLSTITQGAGLAIVAQGTLTAEGRKRLDQVWTDLRIPTSLYQEATFGLSASLLLVSFLAYSNLYYLSYYYIHQAKNHEKQQNWSDATESYKRALNFDPNNLKIHFSLGALYENQGFYKEASNAYEYGVRQGNSQFLIAQARSKIFQSLSDNAWKFPLKDSQELDEASSLLAWAAGDSQRQQKQSQQDVVEAQELLQSKRLLTEGILNLVQVNLENNQFGKTSIPQLDKAYDLFWRVEWFLPSPNPTLSKKDDNSDLGNQFIDVQDLSTLNENFSVMLNELYLAYSSLPDQLTELVQPIKLSENTLLESNAQCYKSFTKNVSALLGHRSYSSDSSSFGYPLISSSIATGQLLYDCFEFWKSSSQMPLGDILIIINLSKIIWELDFVSETGSRPATAVEADDLYGRLVQVKTELQESLSSQNTNLLLKVTVDDDQNIVKVTTYQNFILNDTVFDLIKQTSAYVLWKKDKPKAGEPTTNFWVYYSADGSIQVKSWDKHYNDQEVYDSLSPLSENPAQLQQKLRETVQRYPAKDLDEAELSGLLGTLYELLVSRGVSEWKEFEKQQAYYVDVAGNGAIIKVVPYDAEAKKNINFTPLNSNYDFTHNLKLPEMKNTVRFLVKFKTSFDFVIEPVFTVQDRLNQANQDSDQENQE